MDTGDLALLTESLDRIVARTPPAGLATALDAFGWGELLAEDPAAAVSSLFDIRGRHLASGATLDRVVLAAAGVTDPDTAVVYPPLGDADPTPAPMHGVVQAGPRPARMLIPLLYGGIPVLALAEIPAGWPSTGTGIQPGDGWTRWSADLPAGAEILDAPWPGVRAAAHRALAHELTGIASAMLDLAVDHVSTRTQFGAPLGRLQAVKHLLADVRLAIECARLAAEAAWEDATPSSAMLAKTLATRATGTARIACQQVLGGMGFAWEHRFHRYLKRALLLEPLLGTAERLHAELGRRLRAGELPRMAQL